MSDTILRVSVGTGVAEVPPFISIPGLGVQVEYKGRRTVKTEWGLGITEPGVQRIV